jgi:hypothetical protein
LAEASQQASSFEGLLNESRDLVCERLRAAVAAMLEKADEALAALITATQNREAQEPYQDTRKVLATQRQKLETEFHKAYLTEFRKHTSKVKEAESFADVEASLTLVGEEDLEETLRFKELATKVRKYCDEELAALDQRVGVLLGDANLQAENNPFSPETICDAYQQACHALETSMKVRTVLRKLFDDHVVDAVRAIYKDVNALLVKNSILPKIRYGVSKKPGEKPKAGAKAGASASKEDADEEQAEPAEGEAAAAEQNLFSLLQNLVGGAGGAGGGGGPGGGVALPPGAVILQGAELLGSLTKLQKGDASAIPGGLPADAAAAMSAAMSAGTTTNVLRELKTSSFGAGLVQMDATTLDIVSMLFDQLFDDPKIPAGLKGLIGRLQIPMLKVAIADKSFFARKTHPARQMLDTFGDIAVRLPAEFSADSPTFVHLEVIVQHLIDNFQDDVAVFDGARERLLGVIAEHDKQIEAETKAVAERIEQTENLSVAKTAAEDEVKVRIQAHKMPGPVLEFLVEQWLRLLLIAHVNSGRNGAQWKDAIEAMDQLIWSVEPMKTPEDRRKLAAAVPGLVRRLVAGMQAVGTDAQVRERFFGELMKYHTDALEPKKAKPAAEKPAEAAAEAASGKGAAAASLDFTAAVTVKNPYGAGEVQVTGLDFTPQPVDPKQRAAAKASLKSSLAVDPPADMEMGTWVEFRPKGDGEEHRAAKLLFVSPKKTRYLFSDRRGQNVLELSRAEIVRRLRSGEAVRLDEEPKEPLFDRIMSGLVDKLKTPAKSPA